MSTEGRYKLLVVGVGGQGVLTIARFLGDAATRSGVPVAVGQLHGMSQRGGSVQATVALGDGASAFVGEGEADVVLGLEPLEVSRARPAMSARTRVVMSLGCVVPHTLARQHASYPPLDDLRAGIRLRTRDLVELDGPALAERAGSARALNTVMLGALVGAGAVPLPGEAVWAAVARRCAAGTHDFNRRAYELGREAVSA